MANSGPREQLEFQHNDIRTHSSGDVQYPVVSDDDQVLKLQKELTEARTQIKKIVRNASLTDCHNIYIFIHHKWYTNRKTKN